MELSLALMEERIPFLEWANRISLINNILDSSMPILPSGKEFSEYAKLDNRVYQPEIGGLEFYNLLWKLLMDAKSKEDIIKGKIFKLSDNSEIRISTTLKHASDTLDTARNEWIKFIDTIKFTVAGQKYTQEQIINEIRKELDKNGETLSDKLDAMVCTLGRYIYLAVSSGSFNPTSSKRKGDIFDFSSLLFLSVGAIICTYDKKFQTLVRLSTSKDSDKILLPNEVLELLNKI